MRIYIVKGLVRYLIKLNQALAKKLVRACGI